MTGPSPLHASSSHSAIRISSHSIFSDQTWWLDDLRPGTPPGNGRLRWDFALPDGSCFGDPQWTEWRAAAKLFLWSLKADPPPGRRSVRAGTLLGYFTLLRLLISWMTAEGCRRFIDLDRADSERFLADIASRPGTRSGKPITPESLRSYCNLLVVLYQQGRKYPELTIPDPFPGGSLPASPRDGRGSRPPCASSALRLMT